MNAIPEGIIAAASGGSPQGQASTSGALGAPQNGGGNLPDSGTGTDTAAGGSVDDNWDNYGEPMSSWSFGSIGENHTELRGVCDVSCWGSARALARSAAIMMGWSPQQAHLALEIADYATMFIPSRVITRGAVKTSVIGPIQIGSNKTSLMKSDHFKLRSSQGRSTANAHADLQNARDADIFVQDDGRFVVRGPKGREHIIDSTGNLITTVNNRSNNNHLSKIGTSRFSASTEELQKVRSFLGGN